MVTSQNAEQSYSPIDTIAGNFPQIFSSLVEKKPILAFVALIFLVLCATIVCVSPLFAYLSRQKTARLKHLQNYRFNMEKLRSQEKVRLGQCEVQDNE
ncbi:hypothetical protein EFU33_16855 [Vibrio cholerae]|nr:hypothetical protein [Vibrio cholerae]